VRRGDEQAGDERRQQDGKFERVDIHWAPLSKRLMVSSNNP
jgi:hypothetical protein